MSRPASAGEEIDRRVSAATSLYIGGKTVTARRALVEILADPGTTAAEVAAAIREHAGPLLREVGVFDVFRLADGGRSVAYRLTFQADDRTLTDEEINTVHARVAEAVSRRFGITLRGS